MSSDSEIIARSVETPAAFGELYERHARAIHRYAARRTDAGAAAEDVMSETFLVAFERRAAYELERNDARPRRWNMDELELLRRVRSEVADPSEDALTRGRAARFERVGHEVVGERMPRRARSRTRALRLGWAGLGVAGGAVLVTTLVLTNVLGFAGWRGGASAAAAAVLEDAAVAAISNSDPEIGPGQYLLVETSAVYGSTTVGTSGGEVSWLDITHDRVFVPADRSGDWVWERSARTPYQTFGDESERMAQEMAEQMADEPGMSGDLLRAPAGAFYESESWVSPEALASLPRDPVQLLNHIYRVTLGAGPSPDGEALVFIADRLRSGVVPADLRAAMYRAAALIPGVEITEEQATLDGRTGVAIGRLETVNGIRQDLIVDPDTGLLIGERQVITAAASGFPAGTAIAWTAVTTSVVDDAPEGGTPNGRMDEECTRMDEGGMQC